MHGPSYIEKHIKPPLKIMRTSSLKTLEAVPNVYTTETSQIIFVISILGDPLPNQF